MKYDFDTVIDRRNTGSLKWDDYQRFFPGYDVEDALPMWVADMDFPTLPEVQKALKNRASQDLFGYPEGIGTEFRRAVREWMARRHQWEIEDEWIVQAPGVVDAIAYSVQALTNAGEGVLIQPPVYYPFKDVCEANQRRVVENPLICREDGTYEIDFEDLEKKAAEPDVRLLIFCSPHNPVGRVWTQDELERLAQICKENDVRIVSDEIHSDLIMQDKPHITFGSIWPEGVIVCIAASKTFNLAGLKTAAAIIPDPALRRAFCHAVSANGMMGLNVFGTDALMAAFTYGDDYVDQLTAYIRGNQEYARDFLKKYVPGVSSAQMEGTYFLWLDFRGTGLTDEEGVRKFLCDAKVAGDLGRWFGTGGKGFMRLNVACPREILKKAMKRMERAFLETNLS